MTEQEQRAALIAELARAAVRACTPQVVAYCEACIQHPQLIGSWVEFGVAYTTAVEDQS